MQTWNNGELLPGLGRIVLSAENYFKSIQMLIVEGSKFKNNFPFPTFFQMKLNEIQSISTETFCGSMTVIPLSAVRPAVLPCLVS